MSAATPCNTPVKSNSKFGYDRTIDFVVPTDGDFHTPQPILYLSLDPNKKSGWKNVPYWSKEGYNARKYGHKFPI